MPRRPPGCSGRTGTCSRRPASTPPSAPRKRFASSRIHDTIRTMLTFRFGAEDVLRTRFAISPLDELGRALRIVRSPDPPLTHAAWAHEARGRVGDDLDLEAWLTILVAGPYTPDFLAPPPRVQIP